VIDVPEGVLVRGPEYLRMVAANGFDHTDPLGGGKSASFSRHQAVLIT
jgi:hypothetical protein